MAEIQDVIDAIVDLKTDLLEKINEVKAIAEAPKDIGVLCHHCAGDGQKGAAGSEVSCPDCGGDGYIKFGTSVVKGV